MGKPPDGQQLPAPVIRAVRATGGVLGVGGVDGLLDLLAGCPFIQVCVWRVGLLEGCPVI